MIIDANMYWMPKNLFTDRSLLEKFIRTSCEYGVYAYEQNISETGKRQIVIEKPKGYQNLNYVENQYEMETQLQDMDEAGIDKAVLKIPGCQEWMSLELCKKFNDGMAEHVRLGKGRFNALAVVPPWGTQECIYELERCVYELGMTGVQLSAHYGDQYLDNEAFKPFFKKLNELELPAYIHHTPVPVQHNFVYDYNNLRRSYGRCADQAIAVGREIFSGMFEEFPHIKFIHSMLGGAFFSFMNLMFPQKAKKNEEVDRFKVDTEKMRGYLKNNIFFEMSHAEPWGDLQLECAIKILGADHVIFGTSYPVRRQWMLTGPDFIKNLAISEKEKDLILGENAKDIYKLDK
ncbi:amidohydrolase [Lucifera butyrica]|uniref:Amidohydrolase n=1 Tax=Lucifera butyrica TaxID=1351585 RepID=A0A498REW7_9FIRM|nr:amidohydrolase family protein [Lucifera butyrica]VBB09545.1 amidohydrolase [Lucifera butyrica]